MKKGIYIAGSLIFTAIAFSVYAKSTSSVVDIEPSISHVWYAKADVGNNEPLPVAGSSRKQYIEYVCHNNTLPYVKENIEADGVAFAEFCSCMYDWSIENVKAENLHAFALGFHRANWGYLQRHYTNKPRDKFIAELASNSIEHKKHYGIKSDDVLHGMEQTFQMYPICSMSTAPLEYRGSF